MWLFLAFFSQKGLALEKHCLSCIFITNLFWKESITMQGAQNIKNVLLLFQNWSMLLIRNKCTTMSLRGKKMFLKSGTALHQCFWRVLMSILCLVMHISCVYALKLLSGFFWDKVWLFWWRQVGNPVAATTQVLLHTWTKAS